MSDQIFDNWARSFDRRRVVGVYPSPKFSRTLFILVYTITPVYHSIGGKEYVEETLSVALEHAG